MTNKDIGSLIYATAFSDGMPAYLCSLIEAQSRHETDDYSSHAFTFNKNCFGYKAYKGSKWQRPGLGITSSEGDPYGNYVDEKTTDKESIEYSTHEITDWIKRRQHAKKFPADLTAVDSPFEYASLLKECDYFGDSVAHYCHGIMHFLKD